MLSSPQMEVNEALAAKNCEFDDNCDRIVQMLSNARSSVLALIVEVSDSSIGELGDYVLRT